MLKLEFGMYARLLADIDLSISWPERISVKGKDLNFFVRVEYEKILAFCSNCGAIGYQLGDCNIGRAER